MKAQQREEAINAWSARKLARLGKGKEQTASGSLKKTTLRTCVVGFSNAALVLHGAYK